MVISDEQLLIPIQDSIDDSHSNIFFSQPQRYTVTSINRKEYYKRLRLDSGKLYLDVPLSACVSQNDQIILVDETVSVVCKQGYATLLPIYLAKETLRLGDLEVDLVIKEITEDDEYQAYQSLSDFHYRGKTIHGRTSRLIIRAFHPLFPKVLGYVELATPLYMNKARAKILNAPFKQDEITWQCWDMHTTRQYINLLVRVARCVVYPEFRGLGLGKLLMEHATEFATHRWQTARLKPIFLEIAADMLKFVPFAEHAGLKFIGETEGNLNRVYKDMEYLTRNSQRIKDGEIVQETSSGIVDQQVARMKRTLDLIEQEGVTREELLERLQHLSKETVLRDFALFHEIVSLPKPTYIQGLTLEAEIFIGERIKAVVTDDRPLEKLTNIEIMSSPIQLHKLKVTFSSRVKRTQQSHAVQQAFGISPTSIQTTVLRNFTTTIIPGQVVLIIGPSGAGKTTLLEYLARGKEAIPDEMVVEGYAEFPDNYHPGVFEPIRSKKALIEILADKSVDRALKLMGLVGLSDAYVYLKRFEELSKGQQFRAMLAKLIAGDFNTWLVDEFCANLDPVTASVVADKLQRTARSLGVTLIASAPHCQNFLTSLRPDFVIQLTTAWEYSIFSGEEFTTQMEPLRTAIAQPQHLRLRLEYLRDIRLGKKHSTIRKGKREIKKGLLILESGSDCQAVTVTSVKHCLFKNLTTEDAIDDGFVDLETLCGELLKIYSDLEGFHYVTIVKFSTLTVTPVNQ